MHPYHNWWIIIIKLVNVFSKFPVLNISNFLVQTTEDSLKVGVYFESLCPDSKAFITTQLYPTMAKLGKYLDIDFYPYGNAEVIS